MKNKKKNLMKRSAEAVAMAVVKIEVNSTCPFTIYQPELPDAVQRLRKK